MPHLKLLATIAGSRLAPYRINFASNFLSCMAFGLVISLVISLAIALPPAAATTLYKCKLDGKTVFSDTDCPREVRIRKDTKQDPKIAKPRVIKIRQKSASARSN